MKQKNTIKGIIYATIIIALAAFCSPVEINQLGLVEGKIYQLAGQSQRSDRYSKRLPGSTWLPDTPEYIDGRPVKYQMPILSKEVIYPPNYLLIWTAKWCSQCPQMKVIGDRLKEEGFDVFYLDFDKNQEKAKKDEIAFLPTAVIYTNNEEVRRIIGIKIEEKVEAQIREVLKKNKESNNYDVY